MVATCALQLGRLDDARRYFKQALDSESPEDHAHRTAVTLDHLALVEKRSGNYAEALRLSLQSLVQHRQLGDSAGEALCLNNLGSLCIARHEYEAAATYLQQGLAICERDGIVSTRGLIFCNLMDLAMRTGDIAAAQAHAERALEVAHGEQPRPCFLGNDESRYPGRAARRYRSRTFRARRRFECRARARYSHL